MLPFSLPPRRATGNRLIHPVASFCLREHAPSQRARLTTWRHVATWMFAALVVTMLISAAAPRRAGSESQSTLAFAEPAFIDSELSEDDPPRELKHRESPAKKPRLKALLIHTTAAIDPTLPLSFHARPGDTALIPRIAPLPAAPETRSRREDPALRLHPGQAPPRHVV